MEITFHEVGACAECPAIRPGLKLAIASVTLTKIGKCKGCCHLMSEVCGGCERDETLLHRRDLYGEADAKCVDCHRDLCLLGLRDLFEKGKPNNIAKSMKEVDDEVGMGPEKQLSDLKSWARGG